MQWHPDYDRPGSYISNVNTNAPTVSVWKSCIQVLRFQEQSAADIISLRICSSLCKDWMTEMHFRTFLMALRRFAHLFCKSFLLAAQLCMIGGSTLCSSFGDSS